VNSVPANDDATAALNQVLSEVIDLVQDVKQAHRKVPETHALHAVLDQLFVDLRTWAGMIMDEDELLGTSPLGSMPSVAGRVVPNLWPRAASDEDVHRVVGADLDRLAQHLAAARGAQSNEGAQTLLVQIEAGLAADRQLFRDA